jgi:tetratricopeptide (TPR) repeat protein
MSKRFVSIGFFLLFAGLAFIRGIKADDSLTLWLPEKSWAVKSDGRNFELSVHEFLPDLQGENLQAENKQNGLVMSVFLEPAKIKITASEYRTLTLGDLKAKLSKNTEVRTYEKGSFAFTDYTIRKVEDLRGTGPQFNEYIEKFGGDTDFNQRNVFIYIIKDDTWLNFHLSKVLYSDEDAAIFENFISSITIVDAFQPSSVKLFEFGTYYYRQENYKAAIKYYGKALELEKAKQELPDDLWLVLVDNLGMAYGISGDFENAKSTLDYGVSKKPSYPMFYYNLACNYAEQNDLENSLKNLSLAFKYIGKYDQRREDAGSLPGFLVSKIPKSRGVFGFPEIDQFITRFAWNYYISCF